MDLYPKAALHRVRLRSQRFGVLAPDFLRFMERDLG